MTSERLRRLLERELPRLHIAGQRGLVERFVTLEHGCEFERMESYVESCRELLPAARAAGAEWLAAVLRYLVGRTLAYPLDRPKAALPDLVELVAELAAGSQRGGILAALAELELLRAFHKIDAPGYRETLIAGIGTLWPRLSEDVGPCTELLDIHWRTGFWCRDPALMRAARRLAERQPKILRFSASYWHARELALEGKHADAVALLGGLLEDDRELRASGDHWRLYLAVELAHEEASLGSAESAAAAERRLDAVMVELGRVRDPMLLWDVARARAATARARSDVASEVAALAAGLDVVAGLGTDRVEASLAVALGEVACIAGDPVAFARARDVVRAVLPQLRSSADLEARARQVPGLYS